MTYVCINTCTPSPPAPSPPSLVNGVSRALKAYTSPDHTKTNFPFIAADPDYATLVELLDVSQALNVNSRTGRGRGGETWKIAVYVLI